MLVELHVHKIVCMYYMHILMGITGDCFVMTLWVIIPMILMDQTFIKYTTTKFFSTYMCTNKFVIID